MPTRTKTIPVNGNGASAELAQPVQKPAPVKTPVMKMPEHLVLNMDSVDIDDVFAFADAGADFQWKREFMNRIVVGGIGKYHFSLLVDLIEVITKQIYETLPRGKKSVISNSN